MWMSLNLADLLANLPPQYWHLVVKMSSTLADLPLICWQIYPPGLTSSGEHEFKFGRSTPSLDHRSLDIILRNTQSCIDREICRSHITEIVPFQCFHHFTDGHSLSPPCSLSLTHSLSLSRQSPIDREISRSHITEIVLFLCFHHFMDGHSLSLSLALSLPSIAYW